MPSVSTDQHLEIFSLCYIRGNVGTVILEVDKKCYFSYLFF